MPLHLHNTYISQLCINILNWIVLHCCIYYCRWFIPQLTWRDEETYNTVLKQIQTLAPSIKMTSPHPQVLEINKMCFQASSPHNVKQCKSSIRISWTQRWPLKWRLTNEPILSPARQIRTRWSSGTQASHVWRESTLLRQSSALPWQISEVSFAASEGVVVIWGCAMDKNSEKPIKNH